MASRGRIASKTAVAVVAACVATLPSACGGSGQELASKSPAAILAAATAAANGARSVHVRGNLAQEGKPVKLDLQLTGSGGRAQITLARQRSTHSSASTTPCIS